jgi:uncharacterized protein YciI
MFIVLLKFSMNKSMASQFMVGHKEWIKQGLDDGIFLLIGSLLPNMGGVVLANNISLEDLSARVNSDPFVAEQVVVAEILEVSPNQVDERMKFIWE